MLIGGAEIARQSSSMSRSKALGFSFDSLKFKSFSWELV